MTSTVRNVFFILMFAIIGAILYFIFFGTTNTVTSETYEVQGGWKGVLGVASDSIEVSIARYYYNYCFLPTVNVNNATDTLLGFNSRDVKYSSEVESLGFNTTKTNTVPTKGIASFHSEVSGWTQSDVNYE